MLAPLLIAAAAVPQAGTAPEPPPEDIIVIARKFDRVMLALRKTGTGSLSCTVRRSSGDPEIDALSCLGATTCAETIEVTRDNRSALEDCIKTERTRMIADLVAARTAVAP
jgi:hypothetical protein